MGFSEENASSHQPACAECAQQVAGASDTAKPRSGGTARPENYKNLLKSNSQTCIFCQCWETREHEEDLASGWVSGIWRTFQGLGSRHLHEPRGGPDQRRSRWADCDWTLQQPGVPGAGLTAIPGCQAGQGFRVCADGVVDLSCFTLTASPKRAWRTVLSTHSAEKHTSGNPSLSEKRQSNRPQTEVKTRPWKRAP